MLNNLKYDTVHTHLTFNDIAIRTIGCESNHEIVLLIVMDVLRVNFPACRLPLNPELRSHRFFLGLFLICVCITTV